MVANVRSLELREEPNPELYFSASQDLWPNMSLVVRSTVEPSSLSGSLRQIVNEVDKSVPVSSVKTMDHVVSESITQPRFNLFCWALRHGGDAVVGGGNLRRYCLRRHATTHELGIRIALERRSATC